MTVKQITAKELQQKIKQQDQTLVLLDVREDFEFQLASIEGSV